MRQKNTSALIGAALLMATSAIGPGFLTQTTVFTKSLGASFGFVILVSILIDIGVQLNIWRVIAVSEMRAQDIANRLLPGLGGLLSLLIILGGLAFNIGNVAGAGLGLEALFGIPVTTGAVLSAFMAIAVFVNRQIGKAMDRFTQVMAGIMILAIIYITVIAAPPVAEAALRTVMPLEIDFVAIITLVGGTVGGYITFAGGHRLIDAGVKGQEALPEVSRSAVMGISAASLVRICLFLASLGIIARGLSIDDSNPTASVFQLAAGDFGYRLFGLVMFAAAVTSIIGSAYTSVSFIKSFSAKIAKNENWIIIGFILISTIVFVALGKPVSLLIIAGAVNGIILPISLSVMLIAAYKPAIVGTYKQPLALTVIGATIVVLMAYMSIRVMVDVL
ncbi:Mn2+ and Fe2+ transporters of the NRAMP family [Sphingobacterium nematocida]|uniref:Mn2+ and Fe2+ transporters of the NRAMP family n=1 Tax=Sphingobacterium nematocida TaxID=1513896 RepID=A0A1T5FM86_9SPHI|nr:NRAMP family divalent metal transporter [Sphingobacterium nematocida]SKB97216.1 Mn2+ and Fe2+ transporters of the NRAMP family [Sphingobacterium nematocida]